MVHIRLYIFFIILFVGCNSNENNVLKQMNKLLEEQRSGFSKDYLKKDLLVHFPERIKNNRMSCFSYPASCPPTFKCSSQFGEICFIVDKFDYMKELNELLLDTSQMCVYDYNEDNIIIKTTELRGDRFPVEKCNKWFADKLPIPYFENYDFGLGEVQETVEVDGQVYCESIYSIPSDLQVYVIDAKAGDFWKESCNENRPESLKEWKHGYSRGIAISESENIIVYWTMIW